MNVLPTSIDPQQGLTEQAVQQRQAAGLTNLTHSNPGRTEGQIIVQNLLTFFNFVFVILAAVLPSFCNSVLRMVIS